MKQNKEQILLLLDTHALIHRAYHALPPFRSKSGEPTGALYGLSSMFLKALNDFKPDYVVAAFDRPEPTFRHIAFKTYKAQRPKADDDLIAQLKRAHDILLAFGVPILDAAGFEADDILGTIVEQADKIKNLKIIIVSGDADTFQLVDDDHIVVYTMHKGIQDTVIYDQKQVEERYGFLPKQLIDYKGLRGDASDNIAGVPGIGEKTATKLIKYFGTLENLYKTIEQKDFASPSFLKPRILELLMIHKKDALFSKTLATIRRDAPVQFNLPKHPFVFDIEGAKKIFIKLGFVALLRRLTSREPITPIKTAINKREATALTRAERGEQASLLFSNNMLSGKQQKKNIDIVSAWKNKKDFWKELQVMDNLYFYKDAENIYMIGDEKTWNLEYEIFSAQKEWPPILGSKFFIFPFAKEFIKILQKNKLPMPKRYFDCALAFWDSDSTFRGDSIEELFHHAIGESATTDFYNVLMRLPDIHKKASELLKKKNIEAVYSEIEIPLIPVLSTMEILGIAVDKSFLEKFKKETSFFREKLKKNIYAISGSHFNIDSPAQVGDILVNKLNIVQTNKKGTSTKWKLTSTGKISTRESELVKLQDEYPIIKLILEYRELSKILTTYIEPLLELSKIDGRIHTTFNQEGTVTGRLSSDSPNLQNIPIRSDFSARIRNAFVSSHGFTLVSFDYAQIELKILASLANDTKMINAFKNGIDIHLLTAAEINNIALDKVTQKMRSAAKAINFGIIYGMGIRQLAQNTGMTQDEASKFYKEYFDDFPKIRGYIDEVKKFVHKNGFVSTLYGRRRFFDLQNTQGNRFLEAEMERMAVNAIIQGTDSDIMKQAMIAVYNKFDSQTVRPLLQIHDEMIYEISDNVVNGVIFQIKRIMENISIIEAPLSVEVKIGKRWSELKSIRDTTNQ
ncbi:MAG: DNA polymerase I [Patescibacteria group bacterium]